MRVRVSFRYNAATGEVEVFQVDDAREGPPLPDHDARHDTVTRDVARVVTPHPIVSEVPPGAAADTRTTAASSTEEPQANPGRRLHD
jgi:hypothetical protein